MLVLSRRLGESIVIGDDVVVTVLEVRGDVVRVGVEAPRSVQVRRQELLDELAATNQQAASPDPGKVADLSRLLHRKAPGTGPAPGRDRSRDRSLDRPQDPPRPPQQPRPRPPG